MSEEENRVCQGQWTEKQCIAENKVSIMCVICKHSVSVPKERIFGRHFETKHSDFNQNYSVEFRKQNVPSLIQTLKVQHTIFKKKKNFTDYSEPAVEVSL
jgi:hypothetical protein